MLIAQISDCHVVAKDRQLFGRFDTALMLRQTVGAISSLPRVPDVVLVSGDIAESGAPEEYETFLKIIADLHVPILPVVGNHDDRENLAAAFGLRSRFNVQPGYIQYVVDGFPVRILVIDTTTPRSAEPSLCSERLAWIEAELSKDARPVLIAMHHPPFPAGVVWMEAKAANWAHSLASTVKAHSAVARVVCGHVHRPTTVAWAGTVAMAAPSTAHQVFFDLSSAGPPRFSAEAPGFLIHSWSGSTMTSYGAATPGFSDTIELRRAAPG